MKNKLYKIFGTSLATVLLSMAITACGSSADIAAQSENVVTETSDIDAASGGADLIVAEGPGVGPARLQQTL